MSSVDRFPYRVPSLTGLPPAVQAALQPHLAATDPVVQAVYCPRPYAVPPLRHLEAMVAAQPGKLAASVLVLTEDRLLAASIPEPPALPTAVAAPLASLLRVELGAVLLLGWLEWSWAQEGRLAQRRVFFNTVGEDLIWEAVTALRRAVAARSDLPTQRGQPKEEAFQTLPYKFANLVPNRLMLPEEEVIAWAWQPTIWRRRLGLIKRRRSPATVVALSREHLLIAHEDAPAAGAAYGMIARYCLRSRVADLNLMRQGEDVWLEVALRWQGVEERWRHLFQPPAEPALREIQRQV